MKRTLLLALMPVSLAAAFALPAGVPASMPAQADLHAEAHDPSAAVHRPPPAGLRRAVHEGLRAAVPGALENGLQIVALEHTATGIRDWHRVTGSARLGAGTTSATLSFRARFDAAAGALRDLRVRWSAPAAVTIDGSAQQAIEAAARRALVAEFPDQAPAFELLSLTREPPLAASADGRRVYRGRSRIDFGADGQVLAPIEVMLDKDARVVTLRYSLDELDPAPFASDAGVDQSTDPLLVASR